MRVISATPAAVLEAVPNTDGLDTLSAPLLI